jgi:arginine/lysine/ornithine decarboxylase
MDTPIIDFVKEYANSKSCRLHMPGHKGKTLLGLENLDITEIDGADCLYNANGIIKKSRENASSIFGAHTFYSTEGSSLCIRAMLYLALKNAKNNGDKPFVLAGRNAHKAFLSAVGLLDIDVKWIYPEDNDAYISCSITPQKLKLELQSCKIKPIAVYLTSPDYLGNFLEIQKLAKICKEHNVLLLVDNAHGAYLKFLPKSLHPIDLGADMCCDSAHKTLPALTGSAYLHLSKNLSQEILDQAEHALSIFASTSPSYLLLQSLDAVNLHLCQGYKENLQKFIEKINALKTSLIKHGYTLFGNEPLKITINAKDFGYTGIELNEILKNNGIYCEFYDKDFLVMMFTPSLEDEWLDKIGVILCSLNKKTVINDTAPKPSKATKVLSVKQALLSNCELVKTENALGRIFASLSINCPPAIPIVVCGERIDENAIKCLKYYQIESCFVVKE